MPTPDIEQILLQRVQDIRSQVENGGMSALFASSDDSICRFIFVGIYAAVWIFGVEKIAFGKGSRVGNSFVGFLAGLGFVRPANWK